MQARKFERELSEFQEEFEKLEAQRSEHRERLQSSGETSAQAIKARRQAQLISDVVRKKQEYSRFSSIFEAAQEVYKRYQNDRQAAARIFNRGKRN